jgi:putative addiction module killer protein
VTVGARRGHRKDANTIGASVVTLLVDKSVGDAYMRRVIVVQRTAAFDKWLKNLTDALAQDAIVTRITRIQSGLLGDTKSVGKKVSEFRIDVGAGYRLYYTRQGRTLILLLCAGTKKTQAADIRTAEAMAAALSAPKPKPGGKREQ